MTVRTFVDTNVLVYLFDDAEAVKQRRAGNVLSDAELDLVISTQVLGELYVTLVRQHVPPRPPMVAEQVAHTASSIRTLSVDPAMVRAAIETAQRSQLSYWDALIVEGAVTGGCRQILTEDLQAGAVIRGVEIVNPFE